MKSSSGRHNGRSSIEMPRSCASWKREKGWTSYNSEFLHSIEQQRYVNQYFSPLQCGSHHVRLCNSFNAAKWIIFICKQKNTFIGCPRRSEIVIFLMIVRDHRECYQKKKSLSRLGNDLKRRVNYNNNLLLPFTQQCLGYPKAIVKRVFSRPRGNTILTPNFAHK